MQLIKRTVSFIFAGVLTIFGTLGLHAQYYAATDLDSLWGGFGQANGVNNSGSVVGYGLTAADSYRALNDIGGMIPNARVEEAVFVPLMTQAIAACSAQ